MRKQKNRKKRNRTRITDEENRMTKVRATFINFRRKIEGNLAEDDPEGDEILDGEEFMTEETGGDLDGSTSEEKDEVKDE